jgi:hypothetical protein
MCKVWSRAVSILLMVAFGCTNTAVAPAPAVLQPIVIVPAPGQEKSGAGAARKVPGATTERYALAVSRRTRIDGAAESQRADLASERQLTLGCPRV